MAVAKTVRNYCFYHNDDDGFRSAMPLLRKRLHIPKELGQHAAMAICSCRRKVAHRTSRDDLIALDKLEDLDDAQLLRSLCCKDSDDDSNLGREASIRTYISKAISSKADGSDSALRLILILKMAARLSFLLLEEERQWSIKNCTKNTSKNFDSSKVVKKNTECSCIPFILRKRKRQAGQVYHQVIPMFGGQVPVLFKNDYIGQNFQTISTKYKPCVIELDYKATGEQMRKNTRETCITIWCKRHCLHAIMSLLRETAMLIQNSHDKELQRQRRYYPCSWFLWQFLDNEDETGRNRASPHFNTSSLLQIKEQRQDQYARKKATKQRTRRPKKRQPKQVNGKKEKSHDTCVRKFGCSSPQDKRKSVKCYNCQLERKTLPHRYDLPTALRVNPSLACRHHPGFVVAKKVWSCCNALVDRLQTANKQHVGTGCVQGPHQWRYLTVKDACEQEDLAYL